jgi:hypothetical protein
LAIGSANGLGGGISSAGNGTVTITNSTIANNIAATTGGGFSDENNGLGTLVVSNSLFVNNAAAGDGGAIFLSEPFVSITDTEIRGNYSGGSGGGLFDGGITLTILDNTFSSNFASGDGGGIILATTGTGSNSSTITNSTVANNRSPNGLGGGIFASAVFTGAVTVLNDTITRNFAGVGGGVYYVGNAPSTFSVENTIIAKNQAAQICVADAEGTVGNFTDNGGNLIGVAGPGTFDCCFTASTTQTGTVTSPLDPRLGPLQSNGGPTVGAPASPGTLGTEVPLPGSPLIDKGVASGAPSADERGYLRPEDTGGDLPDVGAVEFLTSQERFVQALYLEELGRPGTLAELDGWVKVLNGTGGRPAVVAGVAGSFEARDRVVKGWYQTFLGRTAMNGEENFWANLLATQTQEQALSQILGSGEFFTHAQTLGFSGSANSQFIQALYSLLLNRTPSSAEINAWMNLLPMMGRQGAALAFLESQEYRTDTVRMDYIDLLHRIGDDLGLNFWVTSSLDLAKIRISLESSSESFGDG